MSAETVGISRPMPRTGWLLSGIVIAFMAADFGATVAGVSFIKQATAEVGYPTDLMWVIGALQLLCAVLYAIPATSVLGATLLTGFLGGAISSHFRVAGTLTPDIVVNLALGALAWAGLWCRDPRLRALAPLRDPKL